MNCQEFESQIILFTELDADEKLNLDVHIQNCTTCKELFESVTATNSLINLIAKVNPVLQDRTKMTDEIMNRIKNPEHHWWNIFDFPTLNLERNSVKYAMATISLFLLAFYGIEQLREPYKDQEVSALPIQKKSIPVIIIRKDFIKELRKGKAIAKSLMTKNCVSPFNLNKVNTACLKQKMALYKEK